MSQAQLDELEIDLEDLTFGPWETTSTTQSRYTPRTLRTFNPSDWAPTAAEVEDQEEQAVVSTRPRILQSHILFENNEPRSLAAIDIMDLENAQQELLDQIEALEAAHEQLEGARRELISVLMTMDEGLNNTANNAAGIRSATLHNAILFGQSVRDENDMEEEGVDEKEEDDDDAAGEQEEDYSNGVPCQTFEECITRAVGWGGDNGDLLEFGLDQNGNSLSDGLDITSRLDR